MSALSLGRLELARRVLAEAHEQAGVISTRTHGPARRGPLPMGLSALDEALGGGLPRGRIVELSGTRSSGRLSLTLSLLARATVSTEPAAFIDVADALDPRALDPNVRARVLWVRPPDVRTSFRCADLLLEAGGFSLVVVYLVGVSGERARIRSSPSRARSALGSAGWLQLSRKAEQAQSTLLVTLDRDSAHAPGSFAHVTLRASRQSVTWHPGEGLCALETEVALSRARASTANMVRDRVLFRSATPFERPND